METAVLSFLNSLSATVFRIAAVSFVVVNAAALATFAMTRSRRMVDRWTPRLVTLDVVLLGAGLGVPLLSGLVKVAVRVAAGVGAGITAVLK